MSRHDACHRVAPPSSASCRVLRCAWRSLPTARRIHDCTPVLAGELYGPLQDPDVFRRVRLDPKVHLLVWPNGADFDPTSLHDWPLVVDELEPAVGHRCQR